MIRMIAMPTGDGKRIGHFLAMRVPLHTSAGGVVDRRQISSGRIGIESGLLLVEYGYIMELGAKPLKRILPPEHLASVEHVYDSKVYLTFSDGYSATIDLAELGIDLTALRWRSLEPSWGSAVEIKTASGKAIHIDSAVLRAYCDTQYAADLEQAVASVEHGQAQ
jgi:hypothetical protein